jgi:hypothetical protein
LDEKIDSYAAGELEHASEAVSAIWEMSRKNEGFPSIPQGPLDPGFSSTMRTSLIGSMQGGSLLHRKYWARRSRGGSLSPVYFPSGIYRWTPLEVTACEWNYTLGITRILSRTVVKYCKGSNGRLENEEDEFPEDSDCESECEEGGDLVSGNAGVDCERGHELLPVLMIGSLVA